MSESIPGKSETELSTEAFVDSMMGIHPNLDREQFHNEITNCVQNALSSADSEDESENDDENDSDENDSNDDEK